MLNLLYFDGLLGRTFMGEETITVCKAGTYTLRNNRPAHRVHEVTITTIRKMTNVNRQPNETERRLTNWSPIPRMIVKENRRGIHAWASHFAMRA